MTRGEIAFAVISGLLINEATDVCPWVAVRLVRWAARLRYPDNPERAAIRAVEQARVINDRPGKLLKLFTALGFALDALVVVRRDRTLLGITGWRAAAKRTIDVGIVTPVLVLMLPAWLFVALAIRLTSRGPVFFHQKRVTKGGRVFRMSMFRTMSPAEPRLTRVGAFLRRVGFDKVPVFWSVLKGDMSIVGPRPLRPDQVAGNWELVRLRLVVPAGLIDWWGINGLLPTEEGLLCTKHRLPVSTDVDPLAIDRYFLANYIENWSPARDLYMLMKVAMMVLWPPRVH